jgi:predicted DNA-binding protein (MmcQ/YjbR family)
MPVKPETIEEICLSLPDSSVSTGWGSPHYKVAKKIFAGCDDKTGKMSLYIKLEPGHTEMVLATDPRFERSRYPEAVQIEVAKLKNRAEAEALLKESYSQVAPKKSLAKLSGAAAPSPAPRTTKKKTPRKKR